MSYSANYDHSHEESIVDSEHSSFSAEDRMDPYNRSLYPHSGSPSERAGPYSYPYHVYPFDRYYTDSYPGPPTLPTWSAHGAHTSAPWMRPALLVEHGSPPNSGEPGPAAYPQSPLSGSSALGEVSPTEEEGSRKANGGASPKKFKCHLKECETAFARKADRDRHYECVHRRELNKKYDCEVDNCSRVGEAGFTRKDHLREHLRNYHHREIPKRTKTYSLG